MKPLASDLCATRFFNTDLSLIFYSDIF